MPTVRCPALIGRDIELRTLRAAIAAARRGCGAALTVVGEPGIGKSRLVNEVPALVGPGTPVLVGRAVGDGQPVAFRPLVEALLAGLRAPGAVDLTALGPFRPVLGRLLPQFREGPTAADDSPIVLAEAVLRLLQALAGEQGLVLALEDLHWADPESLGLVEYLADKHRRIPTRSRAHRARRSGADRRAHPPARGSRFCCSARTGPAPRGSRLGHGDGLPRQATRPTPAGPVAVPGRGHTAPGRGVAGRRAGGR